MTNIVRTPTKATGGITDAERDAMKKHADLWISRAMRTTPVDVDEITSAVHDLYAAAGLKQPRVVVVPSPLVMAFAYGASAAIWWNRKTDNAVGNAVRDAADNAVYNAVYNAVDNATYKATRNAVDACRDLAGALGLACSKRWHFNYQGGASWSAYDSYLTAMRDIIGLRLPEYEKYATWERCAIAAPFRVVHDKFCIISDFPEILKVDDENRPHCETGPSHRWRDGWALYHWHGVSIPAEWIEDKQNLTARTALTWPNIEQRRAACEIIGWDRILSELKARIIDEDDDPQVGTLVEVSLPDAGKERFLRVVCGTGRKFALPVPKEMKTAIQAQAWTYGFDHVADYQSPEVRT